MNGSHWCSSTMRLEAAGLNEELTTSPEAVPFESDSLAKVSERYQESRRICGERCESLDGDMLLPIFAGPQSPPADRLRLRHILLRRLNHQLQAQRCR